jgi:hypothetical protein
VSSAVEPRMCGCALATPSPVPLNSALLGVCGRQHPDPCLHPRSPPPRPARPGGARRGRRRRRLQAGSKHRISGLARSSALQVFLGQTCWRSCFLSNSRSRPSRGPRRRMPPNPRWYRRPCHGLCSVRVSSLRVLRYLHDNTVGTHAGSGIGQNFITGGTRQLGLTQVHGRGM